MGGEPPGSESHKYSQSQKGKAKHKQIRNAKAESEASKRPAADESVKQLSPQQLENAPKPQDSTDTDPSGLTEEKTYGDPEEDDVVKDVLQTLEGDASPQNKLSIVRMFLDVIDTVGSKEDLEVGGPSHW